MAGNQPTSEAYRAVIGALRAYSTSLRQNAGLVKQTDQLLEGNLSSVRKARDVHNAVAGLVPQLNQRADMMESLAQALQARLVELENL